MGTELERRGISTAGRAWTARAVRERPEEVARVHRDYAEAGATVHTAATFRTTPRGIGEGWEEVARAAVAITRGAVPAHHRVAASLAPLEDCYHPERSPAEPRAELRAITRVLAATGPDLLLCETFPHPIEALIAVEECVATGLETWLALTAGPSGDLLTPERLRRAARRALDAGARVVLVNCVPATRIRPFVDALASLGAPFGAYANAGRPDEGLGWSDDPAGPERYADLAAAWVDAGARVIGGCCGTGPAHVRALAARFPADGGRPTAGDRGTS